MGVESLSNTRKGAEARTLAYLEGQGYQVLAGARRTGKSGIEHRFDLLAQRDDGFTLRTIAIQIALGGSQEEVANAIFDFANRAYDVGIKDRVIIAIPSMSAEAAQLAAKQRIKVVDEDKIELMLGQTPAADILSASFQV